MARPHLTMSDEYWSLQSLQIICKEMFPFLWIWKSEIIPWIAYEPVSGLLMDVDVGVNFSVLS